MSAQVATPRNLSGHYSRFFTAKRLFLFVGCICLLLALRSSSPSSHFQIALGKMMPGGASSPRPPPPVNYSTKPGSERPQPTTALWTPDVPNDQPLVADSSIFRAQMGAADPRALGSRSHVVRPIHVRGKEETGEAIPTHVFYSNLYLGSGKQQNYPLPYVMSWDNGLHVHHVEESDYVFGPDAQGPQARYFFAPVGIHSLKLTAADALGELELHELRKMSVVLRAPAGQGSVSFPIVNGAAFVTARYDNAVPAIESDVMFRQLSAPQQVSASTFRWQATLENGRVWNIYWTGPALQLQQESSRRLKAVTTTTGILQVARVPDTDAEQLFDQSAGTYATGTELDGMADGDSGRYSLLFHKQGPAPLLMYALPHHVASFDSVTSAASRQDIRLASQTNGLMTLVVADAWTMQEDLPNAAQLAVLPDPEEWARDAIMHAIDVDAAQSWEQCNADSMYFAGKAIAKLAQFVALGDALSHPRTPQLFAELEQRLMTFVENRQQWPLIYDETWGGLVSRQGFEQGDGADFGNTWYNDHHFHFGYHIYAAAVFLHVAPQHPARDAIVNWTSLLLRDVASPLADSHFPAWRAFDWFVGHSWAKGIYESADGKDEESSSEDVLFAYAAHLFAAAVGDDALAQRSKLMLAVLRRSINTYMLYRRDNAVMPPRFIHNKVSGIKFQNKIDHTTYFGNNPEFVHGIHMLPILPITRYARDAAQVREEWAEKLQHVAGGCASGWRGVLMANLAIADREASWRFFADPGFDRRHLDDGATHAWYLANAATL